jgi:hypothetical protein
MTAGIGQKIAMRVAKQGTGHRQLGHFPGAAPGT